ncbi:MAG: hypothetical protein R3B49_10520 [Phycisphaerales bacterium]
MSSAVFRRSNGKAAAAKSGHAAGPTEENPYRGQEGDQETHQEACVEEDHCEEDREEEDPSEGELQEGRQEDHGEEDRQEEDSAAR